MAKRMAWLLALALLASEGLAAPSPTPSLRAEVIEVQDRGAARPWRLPQARVTREEALLDGRDAVTVTGPWQGTRWAFPRGSEPSGVFDDLRAQLPGTERFTCAGRDCGSSALYAHEVFGVADLYGRDGEQHYALFAGARRMAGALRKPTRNPGSVCAAHRSPGTRSCAADDGCGSEEGR